MCLDDDSGIPLLGTYSGKNSCTCAPENTYKIIYNYATHNSNKTGKHLCLPQK